MCHNRYIEYSLMYIGFKCVIEYSLMYIDYEYTIIGTYIEYNEYSFMYFITIYIFFNIYLVY